MCFVKLSRGDRRKCLGHGAGSLEGEVLTGGAGLVS